MLLSIWDDDIILRNVLRNCSLGNSNYFQFLLDQNSIQLNQSIDQNVRNPLYFVSIQLQVQFFPYVILIKTILEINKDLFKPTFMISKEMMFCFL